MRSIVCFLVILVTGVNATLAADDTLAKVKARGHLLCGVSEGLAGFSFRNAAGAWAGFDVDICRAVAAAVFGVQSDTTAKFVPLTANNRFKRLTSSKIDILSRNTTWTMGRDVDLGLTFPATVFYDGQGFMVSANLPITQVEHLSGARVCVIAGTTHVANIPIYFNSRKMAYSLVTSTDHSKLREIYQRGECEALSADRSALFAIRSQLDAPSEHMILAGVISKEPLGPVVREGDERWADIIRWTVYGLINAEEKKIVRLAMLDEKRDALTSDQLNFLHVAGKLGAKLGLKASWLRNAIAVVGNYGEIFERNVGAESELEIVRGKNALWSNNGLIYAPPMR
ncbi:MAG: amino acid ABC transporter substrate-binding protein [Hyphomicrobiaceae bacterium]